MGSTSLTALRGLDLFPDVLLSLQVCKERFQACLDPWVLWAVGTTGKSTHVPVLFPCITVFLVFMHEVLLNHLQDTAKEVQLHILLREQGQTVLQLMYYKEWVLLPFFIFSRPHLPLSLFYSFSAISFPNWRVFICKQFHISEHLFLYNNFR